MSPSKVDPKFTRGEKCIYVHLIVTFIILVILIIIYFVHLCVVNHHGNEIFRVTRRSFDNKSSLASAKDYYHLVGAVYLKVTPQKIVCNALLLRQQWSLAPAHCVSIYSNPDMADLIVSWRVKYKLQDKNFKETEIKRNIIHSQFSRDDFSNNVGLFEHTEPIPSSDYAVLTKSLTNEILLHTHGENIKIVYWNNVNLRGAFPEINLNSVRVMSNSKCHDYALPIVEQLRSYEFCVTLTLRKETVLHHGAAVFIDNQIIGMFSWGDKRGNGLPFIIINIDHYNNWLRIIMEFF